MKVINNTSLRPEDIFGLHLIGSTISKWRQRNINLYQDPDDDNFVISVGITFNGERQIIAREKKEDWATALDYIKHGKIYVSE